MRPPCPTPNELLRVPSGAALVTWLIAAEPTAYVVTAGLTRRVVAAHRRLGLAVPPHSGVIVLTPETLRRVSAEATFPFDVAAAIGHAAGRAILLLSLPPADVDSVWADGEAGSDEAADALVIARRLGRALVHARLDRDIAAALAPWTEARVSATIDRFGQVAFDEARAMLRDERRLPPAAEARRVLAELTAWLGEASLFTPERLHDYLPSHPDPAGAAASLLSDLAVTVGDLGPLAPAAAPLAQSDTHHETAGPVPERASRLLERLATLRGDAAAPKVESAATRLVTHAATNRLGGSARLVRTLEELADPADRSAMFIDWPGFLTSFGKRPLLVAMPHEPIVRRLRLVAKAERRLARAPLPHDERAAVGQLLADVRRDTTDRLASVVTPAVAAAVREHALAPNDAVGAERTQALCDELGARAAGKRPPSIGELRDALVTTELRLPDATASALLRPSAIAAADAQLARALPGIWRRGEVYLRVLARLATALTGTAAGRWFVLWLALPLGGAFVALEGAQHMVNPVLHHVFHREPVTLVGLPTWAVLSALSLLLFHSATARSVAWRAVLGTWRALSWAFASGPAAVWNHPITRGFRFSAVGRFLLLRLLSSTLVVLLVVWTARLAGLAPPAWAGPLAAVTLALILQTTGARRAQEAALEWLDDQWQLLTVELLPGLFRAIIAAFGWLGEGLERGLFAIEERTRVRRGQSRLGIAARVAVTPLVRLVAYVLRIYVNLLVEPTINPIKHFPVVTVAAKLMIPIKIPLFTAMYGVLHVLSGPVAAVLAGATIAVLPGIFGFLAWELTGYWRLFRANEPSTITPIAFGSHGETMARLLRPGLHSGTVPKLFRKLRAALGRGKTPRAVALRGELHHVEEAVAAFVRRRFLADLRVAYPKTAGGLRVTHVRLGSNRVVIELSGHSGALVLTFEEQSGRLVASATGRTWLASLPEQTAALASEAIRVLMHRAGVDLVREDLAAALPSGSSYDVTDDGLVVFPAGDHHRVFRVSLTPDALGALRVEPPGAYPPLAASVLFAGQPVSREVWRQRLIASASA
jgi:hypothetical protein